MTHHEHSTLARVAHKEVEERTKKEKKQERDKRKHESDEE